MNHSYLFFSPPWLYQVVGFGRTPVSSSIVLPVHQFISRVELGVEPQATSRSGSGPRPLSWQGETSKHLRSAAKLRKPVALAQLARGEATGV